MAETTCVNKIIASNAKQRLSDLESSPRDNNSLIIAGGCSGFELNTDLITQNSLGIVTAALQMQRGVSMYLIKMISLHTSSFSDHPTVNLLSGAQSTDQ